MHINIFGPVILFSKEPHGRTIHFYITMIRIKRTMLSWLPLLIILISGNAVAQANFGLRCAGNWKGTMHSYSQGVLTDSVPVVLEVSQQDDSVFRWKMEYLSEKKPLVKDYHLVYKGGNFYQIDEGSGIEIDAYLFANRLVSVFETEGVLLTSVYEWNKDTLVFEITSGTKEKSNAEVQSYHVGFLQNIRFKRN